MASAVEEPKTSSRGIPAQEFIVSFKRFGAFSKRGPLTRRPRYQDNVNEYCKAFGDATAVIAAQQEMYRCVAPSAKRSTQP